MHDRYGAPMTPRQELDSLIAHFGQLFTDADFDLTPQPLSCLPFTQDDLTDGLSRLPSTKALAPDGFPAVVWRHFAHALAPIVYQAATHAWVNSEGSPPTHWSMGWLHMLSKPNKPPNKPAALRPICLLCLQHPVNEVMTGIHCSQIMQIAFDQLRTMPLSAYLPNQGTRDCLFAGL